MVNHMTYIHFLCDLHSRQLENSKEWIFLTEKMDGRPSGRTGRTGAPTVFPAAVLSTASVTRGQWASVEARVEGTGGGVDCFYT